MARFAAVPFLAACLTLASTASARVTATIVTSKVTANRVVALTFDDGPSLYTPQILAVLRSFHVHATFFEIGDQVAADAPIVRQVVTEGNEIGNHTYTHPDLKWLSNAAIAWQLSTTESAVFRAAHVTPHWFRPPYGAVDARTAEIAAAQGLQPVTWSVDPSDWALPGVAAIIDRVLYQVRPGSIILLHDGGGPRSETVAALPTILRLLMARGYRILTLSELFGVGQPAPAGHCPPSHTALDIGWPDSPDSGQAGRGACRS